MLKQSTPVGRSLTRDSLEKSSVSFASCSACCIGQSIVFELSQSSHTRRKPSAGDLVLHKPIALIALLPEPAILFSAGAVAGALGKTLTAPLDRVKLLLQTRGGFARGKLRDAAQQGRVLDSLIAIGRQEGFKGYWRGNVAQILKVIPYSATQLYSYELFKTLFDKLEGGLSIRGRLAAGASAGMTATLVTYPLDTLRLRMAVDPAARSIRGATSVLLREGSYNAFFRGLGASLFGIAPYMAMELCLFDLMPQELPPFIRGFSAALIATTVCYPLDTIRRHIQLQSSGQLAVGHMARQIWKAERVPGFYRGFVPSAVKNLPNKDMELCLLSDKKFVLTSSLSFLRGVNAPQSRHTAPWLLLIGNVCSLAFAGIRLAVFDQAKRLIKRSQAAYEEACGELEGTPRTACL